MSDHRLCDYTLKLEIEIHSISSVIEQQLNNWLWKTPRIYFKSELLKMFTKDRLRETLEENRIFIKTYYSLGGSYIQDYALCQGKENVLGLFHVDLSLTDSEPSHSSSC